MSTDHVMEHSDRTGPGSRPDPSKYYTGIIHLHSWYSHDGHGAIPELSRKFRDEGIDFCILTDHFEDFDSRTFTGYLADLEDVNRSGWPLFIPAVEAEFQGFHVIFLPVSDYETVRSIVNSGVLPDQGFFTVLAHPSKHTLAAAARFLASNRVNGVEIWNQQADGNHAPPARFFRALMDLVPEKLPILFFGSDVHNVSHRVNNLLLLARDNDLTAGFVLERLRQGDFLNHHRVSPARLPGMSTAGEVREWLLRAEREIDPKTKALLLVKKVLKFYYHLLPRPARRLVNDFKNSVKNRL